MGTFFIFLWPDVPGEARDTRHGAWALGSRWSSAFSDPQWIAEDLGAPKEINRVELYWETARALAYEIQINDYGQNWKPVFATDHGSGSRDVIKFSPVTTRWVRMFGTKRGTK